MRKTGNGLYTDSKGYLTIHAGPLRGFRVHRLIAEAKLGRKLKKDEVVHHKNGNKLDCRPENLDVLGVRQHNAVSSKQYWWLKEHDMLEKIRWDMHFDGEGDPGVEHSKEGDVTFP